MSAILREAWNDWRRTSRLFKVNTLAWAAYMVAVALLTPARDAPASVMWAVVGYGFLLAALLWVPVFVRQWRRNRRRVS